MEETIKEKRINERIARGILRAMKQASKKIHILGICDSTGRLISPAPFGEPQKHPTTRTKKDSQ